MESRARVLRFCEIIPLPNGQSDLVTLNIPVADFEYAYVVAGAPATEPQQGDQAARMTCVVCAEGEKHFVTDPLPSIAERHGLVYLCGEVFGTHPPYFTRSGVVVKRRNASLRQSRGEDGRTVTAVTLAQMHEPGGFGPTQAVFLTHATVQSGPRLVGIKWIKTVRDGQAR